MTRTTSVLTITLSIASVGAAQTPTGWPVPSSIAPGLEVRADESGNRALARFDHEAPSSPTPQTLIKPANWKSLGPFGGDIDDVQASPVNASIVLAGLAPSSGGGGGLYRSTNAGASWTEVGALTGRSVHDVAFASDGTAYIGTIDSVWKSVDGGASWTQQNLGIGLNDQVFEVDVDPANAQRIWIGVADALGFQAVNVMLSVDGGTTWMNKTPPLASPRSCNGIALHPSDSNKVYACFDGGQVWVSSNGGTSWVNRSAGLPANPLRDIVHDGTRVLVGGGQLFGSQFVGLYASANDGMTWTPLHDGTWPSLVVHDIGIDPNDPAVLYVATAGKGLFRSNDGGSTWSFQVGGTGSLSVNAVSFSPGSSSVIYIGSSSAAVWKSTDSGASFAASSTGIGALDVFSIASNPNDAGELAIAFQGLNNGGVYTTLDGGSTWSLAALPATRFSHVYFAPTTGQLYAISSGPSSIAPEGLYRRTGTSWSSIGPNQGTLFESDLTTMRVSRSNPSLIVAAGADFGVAGNEPTVWRTTNGGGMWTKTYEGPVASKPVQDLAIVDEIADTTMVAVQTDFSGAQHGGVLRSTNVGVTWLPSNAGLPLVVEPFSLAKSPTDANTLFISNSASAAGNGVFKSVDSGQTWTATGFVGSVREVQTDVSDPNALYIAMFTAPKLRSSSDGGVTFTPYDTGLAGVGSPRDLQRATGVGSDLLLAATTGSYATDLVTPVVAFCFGDGSGATACPCDNFGAQGRGCGNSNPELKGARLSVSGTTNPNTLVLTCDGIPNNNLSTFLRGNAVDADGVVFGDGLLCVSGAVIRFGQQIAGQDGNAPNTVATGTATVPAGSTRWYQCHYRNPAAAFCPPAAFNVSNGIELNW